MWTEAVRLAEERGIVQRVEAQLKQRWTSWVNRGTSGAGQARGGKGQGVTCAHAPPRPWAVPHQYPRGRDEAAVEAWCRQVAPLFQPSSLLLSQAPSGQYEVWPGAATLSGEEEEAAKGGAATGVAQQADAPAGEGDRYVVRVESGVRRESARKGHTEYTVTIKQQSALRRVRWREQHSPMCGPRAGPAKEWCLRFRFSEVAAFAAWLRKAYSGVDMRMPPLPSGATEPFPPPARRAHPGLLSFVLPARSVAAVFKRRDVKVVQKRSEAIRTYVVALLNDSEAPRVPAIRKFLGL